MQSPQKYIFLTLRNKHYFQWHIWLGVNFGFFWSFKDILPITLWYSCICDFFFVQKKLGFSNYEAYSEIRLAHQNEIETIQPDMLITVPSQRRVRTLCLSLSFFSITSHKAPQKIFLPSLSFHRVMLLNSAHGDPLDTIQPRLPLINLNSLNHTSKYQRGLGIAYCWAFYCYAFRQIIFSDVFNPS